MAKNYPDDLRYTKDHEWVRIDDKHAHIGITEYAVQQLGDITMVDLPKEKEAFRREESIATVESVKAVSDVYAPLSGTVVRVNTTLNDTPETLNEDPYDDGWILVLDLKDPSEIDKLMTAQEYEQYLREQAH